MAEENPQDRVVDAARRRAEELREQGDPERARLIERAADRNDRRQ